MEQKIISDEILKTFDTAALLNDPIIRGLFICLPDEQCRTEFINQSMLSLLGCKNEEEFRIYSDGKIHNLIHPEDIARVEEVFGNASLGNIFEVTYRIKCKSKQYKWILKKGRLISTEDNRRALVCVCTELTELMNLKEKLIEKESEISRKNIELSSLMENIPGGVHRCKLFNKISMDYASDELCKLVGYGLEEIELLFNNDYALLVHPDDRAEFKKMMVEISQKEDKRTIEYRLCTKEGKIVWVTDTIKSVRLEDGNMWGFAVVTNIDKSKREHIKLQALMDTLPGAVIQYKYDETKGICIEYFNQGASELLGYSQNQLKSRAKDVLIEEIYEEDKALIMGKFRDLLHSNKAIDCTYRLYVKDNLIWVRMLSKAVYRENHNIYIISTLFNVTKEMEAKKQKQWDEQRYKLLMEGSDTLTFDYNPATDVLCYRGQDITKKYMEEDVPNFTENMNIFVKEEQLELAKTKLKEASITAQSGSIDFHLSELDGTYNWYRVKYISIADDNQQVYRVIGRLDDINESKLEELELKEKLGKDSLTNLLNRVKFEENAQKKLQNAKELGEGLTFILLDLDDFKAVNDNYGHLIGDKLLQSFASMLQSLFRKDDIIARLGGDEMAVIMPKTVDKDILHKKISEIFDRVRRLSVDGKEMPAKCSIGVAIYPNHAEDFDDLYHCADVALYQAKGSGKNQYCIYNEESKSPSVGEWVDKEWLLDTIGALVYISDINTHELIYLSKAMCQKFDIYNYRNKKCYEVLQGRKEPCDFCTNEMLGFDEFYCWEYVNPKFNVKAHLKDKLVYWEGRIARMEVVTELE